ncbi:argininosuccinate lyase [Paragemmobacter ruber]|uniref:Argininosuccinate lyase n=1 Tax=Paragemmobacter ruber TaxID=1985673 RepID=A0ABW9Y4J2_9RHOB|nr:argininosuccinate lyase [Rhodobacter ruber]NBE07016.1 argininosuccinate lyase [Rhodobacter ruber]
MKSLPLPALPALALIALLAACGADGPPVPPSQATGLAVSGSVETGIVGGN